MLSIVKSRPPTIIYLHFSFLIYRFVGSLHGIESKEYLFITKVLSS
jgi:hypothetical protein